MHTSPLRRLLARTRLHAQRVRLSLPVRPRSGDLARGSWRLNRTRAGVLLVAAALLVVGARALWPAANLFAFSQARTVAREALAASVADVPVAPQQQNTPVASGATATPTAHTVQPGETLSEIAELYGFSVEHMLRVNGIPNANAIYVGQKLRLPQVDRPVGVTIHVIEAGDTLGGIARFYGVDINELMARNGLKNPNDITSGQELVIPEAGAAGIAEPAALAETAAPTATPLAAASVAVATPVPAPTVAGITVVGGQPGGTGLAPSVTVATTPVIPVSAATDETAAVGPAAATPAPVATDAQANVAAAHTHTVKPGETASGIAKQYGIGLRDLLRANGIANADLLRSGAELIIPGAALDAAIATAEAVATVESVATVETVATVEAVARTDAAAAADKAPAALPMSQTAEQVVAAAGSAPVAPEIAHSVTGAAPLPERPAASLNRTYTIVSGDTLGRIASRQGVNVDALGVLNGLPRDAALRAGGTLLLPATDNELLVRTPDNVYTVQPGDSLSAIAVANRVELGALMAANGIRNANALQVGQELVVPGRTIHGQGPLKRVGPAPSGYYYYVVQAGDTLSELEERLNTTKTALMDYNNLTDEATIISGMELRVPYGAPQLPKRTPPVPVSGNSFLVSLSRQQCWVLTGTQVLHAWNCSTGRADRRTKTGSFAVQSKIDMAQSNVWRLDMPYWLGIYDVGRVENGIHGLPIDWDTGKKIWTRLIGQPATFGCAMLGDEDAATLFDMAYLGMPVTIVQ